MEITEEQITNSVLEAVFRSDQYINTGAVSLQTGVDNAELIEAVNRIKQYNELFLDVYKNSSKENLLNLRVPEFIRDEVRQFLDNGGFISLRQNSVINASPELKQPELHTTEAVEQQPKRKITKNILKAAGLIALLTLTMKKSLTFFRK